MTREIKFRCWDKEDGRMYFPTDIKLANDGITWIWDRVLYNKDGSLREDDSIFRNLEHIEVMQFTGLKDKNGKEIYEGDIISSGGLYWEIFWCQGNCGFNKRVQGKQSFNPEPPLRRNQIKQMQIIGNKFENLELLKNGGQSNG